MLFLLLFIIYCYCFLIRTLQQVSLMWGGTVLTPLYYLILLPVSQEFVLCGLSYLFIYIILLLFFFFLNIHSDKYYKINQQSLQLKINYMLFWPFRPAMSNGSNTSVLPDLTTSIPRICAMWAFLPLWWDFDTFLKGLCCEPTKS
jgi:hypothetical protein